MQLPAGVKVDHGEAFGRIAFMTNDIMPKFQAATDGGHKVRACGRAASVPAPDDTARRQVINTPIKLDTPGKATVEVTILADPDGTEICFVERLGFIDLATTKPGCVLEERRGRAVVDGSRAVTTGSTLSSASGSSPR